MSFVDKDLLSIQEARILMESACEAGKILLNYPQKKLDEAVKALAQAADAMAKELSVLSAEETGHGCAQDKYVKNTFVCQYLPEKLCSMKCVGILKEDEELGIMEVGVPIGCAVILCPVVSPVSTAISNVLTAIKAGCPAVVIPHERAVKTTALLMEQLSKAAERAGLPEGAVGFLRTVTKAGAMEAVRHQAAALVVNTGVRALHKEASKSGKPYIYGGTGKSPVFIEQTANVEQAVKDILDSRSFDYGIAAASEQYVVADRRISLKVKAELIRQGAYFMDQEEEKKLVGLLNLKDSEADEKIMGRPASELAYRAGFPVDEDVRVLVSEQKYISDRNPFAKELFCPVLAFYIENDWTHACEKCMELLRGEDHGHTMAIHSMDPEVIRQFALKKPVGRVLVNTPAVFGSMGATSNLFPAMTLGSMTAGAGITADNLSPANFTYIRRVGRGVRSGEEFLKAGREAPFGPLDTPSPKGYTEDAGLLLQRILEMISEKTD